MLRVACVYATHTGLVSALKSRRKEKKGIMYIRKTSEGFTNTNLRIFLCVFDFFYKNKMDRHI